GPREVRTLGTDWSSMPLHGSTPAWENPCHAEPHEQSHRYAQRRDFRRVLVHPSPRPLFIKRALFIYRNWAITAAPQRRVGSHHGEVCEAIGDIRSRADHSLQDEGTKDTLRPQEPRLSGHGEVRIRELRPLLSRIDIGTEVSGKLRVPQ